MRCCTYRLQLLTTIIFNVLQSGCNTGLFTAKLLPDSVADQITTTPTIMRVEGRLWVVGLPANHGWTAGKRALLTKHDTEKDLDVKVGVVTVLDDGYATVAPVGTVYQEPGQAFDGARAEIVKGDQPLRLGRGFGKLVAVRTTSLVEIDLGREDGVGMGDVYEVRSSEGSGVLGLIKVVASKDHSSRASVLHRGAFAVGQEVVFRPPAPTDASTRTTLRVVVCNFFPLGSARQPPQVAKAFAHDLADHLRNGLANVAEVEVLQAPQTVRSDADAKALGAAYPADLVVWGSVRQDALQGTARPVFTAVSAGAMPNTRREGADVTFRVLNPARALEAPNAADPLVLALGLLADLAHQARRYSEAGALWREADRLGHLAGDAGVSAPTSPPVMPAVDAAPSLVP